MNPTDLSNSLLYGVPIIMYAHMHQEFESLLKVRGRSRPALPSTAETSDDAIPASGGAKLRCSIATSPEELKAARKLVRERYAWRGYDISNIAASQNEAGPVAREEITFVVASGDDPVGTVTLGLDGPGGLFAEATDDGTIAYARSAGRRVCELVRLAVVDNIDDSKAVFASLFSLAHAVARTVYDITDVFIEVNPRHVAFYTRVMGFVVAAGEKVCERVRAPSVLLALELDALEDRLDKLGFCKAFVKLV